MNSLALSLIVFGCVFGGALLGLRSRPLDVLSLGTEEAAALGLAVSRTRLLILGLAALVAGACTAVAGSVPFVGLVAPHLVRARVGFRHPVSLWCHPHGSESGHSLGR